MASWIRRAFSAPGLTQIPAGPQLPALQGRFGGTVMLCIDVSGSMDGAPILEAVRGGRQFVAEAVAAHYKVGVMLWNHLVAERVRAHRGREGGAGAARPRWSTHGAKTTSFTAL